ncbi:MAG: IS630 transposase-related protein [Pseudomonadota bacterium]
MPKPYSTDLRDRVVAVIVSGVKYNEAAERFAVSAASISRWPRLHRQAGTVEPAPFGGLETSTLAPHEEKIRVLVEGEPDLTLAAMLERLAADGIETSRTTLHRFLKKLGLTLKKRRRGQPSRTAKTLPKHATLGEGGKPR